MSIDPRRVEERLHKLADVVLVDPRVIRHVIKAHRDVTGLVPHTRCYAIRREALVALQDRVAVHPPPSSGRRWLLLVALPSTRDADEANTEDALEMVVRASFHALVHSELEQRQSEGLLDERAIRRRIELIGRTEFQEIRAAIKHDDLLLPPGSDREVYIEFCALYLELREFSPALIVTTFPGLANHEHIDNVLATDLDVATLLTEPRRQDSAPPPSRRSSFFAAESERASLAPGASRRSLRRAERAIARGRLARGAIFATRATRAAERDLRAQAQSILEDALDRLSSRLEAALRGARLREPDNAVRWREVVSLLSARRPPRAGVGQCPEDRVLLSLQNAIRAYHQPGVIVDVPSWILSFGTRPIVRPHDTARELQIARCIDNAAERAQRLGMPSAERASVTSWLEEASRRAETNIRQALRPRILGVFRRVGLTPKSGPERQALSKLADELLDQIVERGYLSLPQLRDAVSRNEAKMRDVSPLDALLSGDSLLRADRELSASLDGIYRRGDLYVRALQKASSLCFGNGFGRALSLYVALPVLGAFTVLEAVRHLVGPVLVWMGFSQIHPLNWINFAVTAGCIFALVHSESFRISARQALDAMGIVLAWAFFRIPRAILWRPAVRRWLARPSVRGVIRRVIVPASLAAVTFFVLPLRVAAFVPIQENHVRGLTALLVFLFGSALMASRIGYWLESFFVDRLAPTWQALSRQWIPQVVRLIGRVFSVAMDSFERIISRVDNALRFRRSRSSAVLVVAGAVGAVWAMVAYVVRLYVTLLVEPEINPLKHFPVVTVAHKLILPFLPELLSALERPLAIFGPILGGTIAGVTVFLLPSVFGFLVWEFKENYRLYRATRSVYVPSGRLGPEGETMHGLLVPGIHSGTLPKLYDRLRRAAQRREAQMSRKPHLPLPLVTARASPELGRFRERLRVVEKSVRRFTERELLPAVSVAPAWKQGPVHIESVDLSSNRIRVRLGCAGASGPCELTFEQLGGWVVASISRLGFVENLEVDQAALFENALAVFYHRAEVELVREQIDAELGTRVHYNVVDDGLLVWPGEAFETELSYKLRRYRPGIVRPKLNGRPPPKLPVLDTRRIVYAHQRIAWRSWEQAWAAAYENVGKFRRLLDGPSILPPSVQRAVPA